MEQMDPEGIVGALEALGLGLYVGEDGVVHGRMRDGGKIPMEAWRLVDELRLMNDAVAAYLTRARVKEYKGIPAEECLKMADDIKAGRLELVGKVIYHKASGLCDITVREVACGG